MDLKIKLLNERCMPTKKYKDDAGLDLRAKLSNLISIPQFSTDKIPTGICVEIPPGHFGLLLPRSGHASKGVAIEIGTVDSGYTGELVLVVTNNSSTPYHVQPYERLGQLVIVPYTNVTDVKVVNKLTESPRGTRGFGSTGKE